MEYSIVAILALLILLIINYDILKTNTNRAAYRAYRRFLIAVAVYFISDSFWGILYEAKLIAAVYADTVVYYLAMAVAVFLWTQAVIAYLNENNAFTHALYYAGWVHIIFDVITLAVNFFIPIKFYFDKDGIYHACAVRYIALLIQILLFLTTALYILFITYRQKNKTPASYNRSIRHSNESAYYFADGVPAASALFNRVSFGNVHSSYVYS